MSPHVCQERTKVGELLPTVARHLAQERPLAVYHLVMGQRQDVVLGVGVRHRQRQLAVMVLAVDRWLRAVGQRVMHPAHVPFEAEAETTEVRGPSDAGP